MLFSFSYSIIWFCYWVDMNKYRSIKLIGSNLIYSSVRTLLINVLYWFNWCCFNLWPFTLNHWCFHMMLIVFSILFIHLFIYFFASLTCCNQMMMESMRTLTSWRRITKDRYWFMEKPSYIMLIVQIFLFHYCDLLCNFSENKYLYTMILVYVNTWTEWRTRGLIY